MSKYEIVDMTNLKNSGGNKMENSLVKFINPLSPIDKFFDTIKEKNREDGKTERLEIMANFHKHRVTEETKVTILKITAETEIRKKEIEKEINDSNNQLKAKELEIIPKLKELENTNKKIDSFNEILNKTDSISEDNLIIFLKNLENL